MIKTENLSKSFFRQKALDNINLEISPGKVYGILGPNGSGKTTLFKILGGLYKASAGTASINGFPIGVETKKRTAYMPTEDFLFDWMKIKGILDFYQDMYADFDRQKAQGNLAFMDLTEDMKVSSLSTGMKARLKLVITMARKADLYLLDEPLNGIDPISREKTLKLIVSALDESCTLLISSHLVSELEAILDEVIFLDRGKIILTGDAEQFRTEKGCSIEELYKEVYHG